MTGWADPVAVSPIIRMCRWGALVAGVFYGVSKHAIFKGIEESHREERLRLEEERARELAIERQQQSDADIEMLGEIFVPTHPPPRR